MIRFSNIQNRNIISFLKNYTDFLNSKIQSVKFPEKLKGTVVEKWKDYWVNLMHDYADVAKDTYISAKTEPRKTAAILSFFGFGAYCFKTNPDENSYRDTVLSYSSEYVLIGPTVRNPEAKKYLEEIENYHNENVLHRLSLGLFSVIWKDNYNDNVAIYKAQCPYLGVPFYRFYEQIVDIGFMDKWHVLSHKMIDFDINPDEWKSES